MCHYSVGNGRRIPSRPLHDKYRHRRDEKITLFPTMFQPVLGLVPPLQAALLEPLFQRREDCLEGRPRNEHRASLRTIIETDDPPAVFDKQKECGRLSRLTLLPFRHGEIFRQCRILQQEPGIRPRRRGRLRPRPMQGTGKVVRHTFLLSLLGVTRATMSSTGLAGTRAHIARPAPTRTLWQVCTLLSLVLTVGCQRHYVVNVHPPEPTRSEWRELEIRNVQPRCWRQSDPPNLRRSRTADRD